MVTDPQASPLIVFVDMPEAVGRDISIECEHLPVGSRIESVAWSGNTDTLVEACKMADAVLTDYVPFPREVLLRLPNLKIISVWATGWDCVDITAARELGIGVTSVGDYCTDEVADHTLALLLALNRRIRDYDRQVQLRRSWRWNDVRGIRALKKQTLGLVGCGRIGRAVARRALGFGLRVIAFDPLLDQKIAADAGVQKVTFETLLAESDIVSLHCPLTPENTGLFNERTFVALQQQPFIINVSRGGLIVENDLVNALDTGRISGAALDVLANESPDLESHPLNGRDDVLLTPHVAFYSVESLANLRRICADNIRNFLEGRFDKINRLVVGGPGPGQ